jgi:hypothetical protein
MDLLAAPKCTISGNTVVVGDSIHGFEQAGALYVFLKPAGGWMNMTQTAELTVSNTTFSCLGTSVSVADNVILAGADCTHGFTGVAYVFLEPKGGWQNSSKFSLRLSVPFSIKATILERAWLLVV